MKIALLDTEADKTIEKKFIPGEKNLGIIRRHFMFLIIGLLKNSIYISIWLIISWGIFLLFNAAHYSIWLTYSIIFLLSLFIFYKLACLFIDYKYDFLIGTNYRIFIYDHNFIFYSCFRPINFDQIEEINLSQKGLLHVFLKYGKVSISVKGKGDKNEIIYNYAKNAEHIIDKISNAHAEILKGKSHISNKYDHTDTNQNYEQKILSKGFIKRSDPVKKIDDHISDKVADVIEKTISY